MRDSSWRPSSTPPPLSELPQPFDDPNLIRTFAGFRMALRSMSIPQLMSLAGQQAAALELEAQAILAQAVSARLSGSQTNLDSPVIRSPRTAPPSSGPGFPDRGQGRSQPFPPPRPSAVDLLASSQRLAPRIAAKLVLAEAQRARAERG